jgi:site-specific recombinase XerD
MTKEPRWRRHLSFKDWPAVDHAAWSCAIEDGDILDGRGPAAHWADATKRTNCQHYGRWLGYLVHHDLLAPECLPEDRVTKGIVRTYVEHLRSEVAPRTVVSSLVGLKVMMKAMAPEANWRWLADVCNALNRSAKPQRLKSGRMRSTGEIYATAIAELDRLLTTTLMRRLERVAYRDTLMLAMMSARPLRLKNFANVQIGTHLIRESSGWIILVPGEETKNGQTLEYALPTSLHPYLETYLGRIRPSFEPARASRSLWLEFKGGALEYHSIYCRFILVTQRLLGVEINPHLLRDCAATSLSTESPAAARSAAVVLGHRYFATTERYYVRANQLEASRNMNATLSNIKDSLK